LGVFQGGLSLAVALFWFWLAANCAACALAAAMEDGLAASWDW